MSKRERDHSDPSAATGSAAKQSPGRGRRLLRRLTRVLALLVAFVAVGLMTLEVDFVVDRIGRWAVQRFSPFESAELTIGRASGGLLSGLQLSDVALKDTSDHTLVSVPRVSGRVHVLPLLKGHVVLTDLSIERPDVVMAQRADSTWDLMAVLPADTAEGSTRVTVRDLQLVSGRLTASFQAGDRDSTLRVHEVTLALANFQSPGNSFALDSMRALFSPPGSSDTVVTSIAAAFEDNRLDIRRLYVRSPVTHLEADGRLTFVAESESFEDVAFNLVADPLTLRDISAFVPILNPAATVEGQIHMTGSSAQLDVDSKLTLGDGAIFSMVGTASPPESGPLRYDLTAEIQRLDPNYLLRMNGASPSPITASMRVDLAGPGLSELSGDVRLEASPFEYGGFDVSGLAADANLVGGDASYIGSALINGSAVSVDGSGRPLDEVAAYRALIRADHVNVGRFLTDTSYTSDLSVDAWVDVRGTDVETMDGSIDIRLRPSRWESVDITEAASRLRIRDGRIDVDLSGTVGAGRIDGRVSATLGETVQYTIHHADLQEVNLAALAGDTTASSVNLHLTGSARGLEAATARADLDVRLDSTYYGVYRVRSGTGSLRLSNAQLAATADLDLVGGHVVAEGMARPFDARKVVEIASARFDSVDVSRLGDRPAWRTRLSGSLEGRAVIYDGRATGRLAVQIDSSRINDQEIISADVAADIVGDDLSVDIDATIPGGQIILKAAGRPFDDVPIIEVTEGRLAGIDLSRILADARLRTDLNASFAANVSGFDTASMVAMGRFDLEQSVINSDTLREGSVVARADSGVVTLNSDVRLGGGQVMLVGFSELAGDEGFELIGAITDVSPTRLVGADSLESRLNLDLALSGRGLTTDLSLRCRIDVRDSALEGIALETGVARFSLDGGLVTVDTVTVRSNVGSLAGGGRMSMAGDSTSLPSNLVVHAELDDLAPVGRLLPTLGTLLAQGTLDASVTGSASEQRVRVDGRFRQLASGDLRVGEVRMRGVGRLEEGIRLRDAEARLEAEQPSLPNIAARTLRVDAAYRDRLIRFEGSAVVDDQTDGRASGQIELDGDYPVLTLEALRFGRTADRWELLTTSTVTLGPEYRVSNLLLYSGQQQVAIDGFIDLQGEQSLVVSLEGLRVAPVANFFGYEGLGGVVNGYIDLTGRAQAPRVLGSLSANISSLGQPVGDFSLDLDYSDLEMQIDALLRDEAGRTLSGRGRIPVDFRLSAPGEGAAGKRFGGEAARGETAVTIAADGFAIGWIKPFLDPTDYSNIAGRLTGRVELSGTFDQPVLAGSANIVDGLLGLTQFGVTYTNIRVDARFAEDLIYLDHFEATSSRGNAIGQGSVSLSELNLGDFNIEISMEEFRAVDNRQYRAVVGGDLTLTGTTRRPRLDGAIEVVSADIFLAQEIEEFQPVRLSMQDLLTVEQRFGIRLTERDTTTFNFYEAMSMDIKVTMSRNTWLRSTKNPTMDIQFTGSLDVSKLPFQDEQVFGSIQVLPERSRIVQFGKSFAIKKGDLTYNGSVEDPVLDLEAEYAINAWRNPDSEVTITLSATGRLDELDVELTSDPTMELTDIVSYIAFGRPASESLHLGGGGQGGSLATGLALGQVANLIEGVAGSGLGLDVVEIEQQGLDTRLTAGKYVHSKLYLSISQPLSLGGSTSGSTFGNKREITAEFEIIESILLRLLSRKGSISVNLLWQYAY